MAKFRLGGWYLQRLFAMPPAEYPFRIVEQLRRRKIKAHDLDPRGTISWGGPRRELLQFLLQLGETTGAPEYWEEGALRLLNSDFEIAGMRWPVISTQPDWDAEPLSGIRWADGPSFQIEYRQSSGEIRLSWEATRLLWLLPAALHATRTGNHEVAERCSATVLDWLAKTPAMRGISWATGVEIAHQLVALTMLDVLLDEVSPDSARSAAMARRAAMQLKWLELFPSRHSSANNHRISELCGQVIGRSFLREDARPAMRHLSVSTRSLQTELENEIVKQHTSDGFNREQAPAYGRAVLEWLSLTAEVAAWSSLEPSPTWYRILRAAADRVNDLSDSGGHYLCFGDDDGEALFSIAWPADLRAQATASTARRVAGVPDDRALDASSHHLFGDGGYSKVIDRYPGARTVEWWLDHAPLGYSNLAAHAHADSLAVWLSIDGEPTIVEAGTYLYHGGGEWRNHFRGSAAHNTVVLQDQDSSRSTGPFSWSRVRRARASLLTSEMGVEWKLVARHDGYQRRFGVVHERQLQRVASRRYVVHDRLLSRDRRFGRRILHASSCLLLAPDIEVEPMPEGWELKRRGRQLVVIRAVVPAGGSHAVRREVRSAWYSPQFGRIEPTLQLTLSADVAGGHELELHLDVPR